MICVKTSHVCILFLRSWKRKTNVSRRIVGILMDILAAGGGGGGVGGQRSFRIKYDRRTEEAVKKKK